MSPNRIDNCSYSLINLLLEAKASWISFWEREETKDEVKKDQLCSNIQSKSMKPIVTCSRGDNDTAIPIVQKVWRARQIPTCTRLTIPSYERLSTFHKAEKFVSWAVMIITIMTLIIMAGTHLRKAIYHLYHKGQNKLQQYITLVCLSPKFKQRSFQIILS